MYGNLEVFYFFEFFYHFLLFFTNLKGDPLGGVSGVAGRKIVIPDALARCAGGSPLSLAHYKVRRRYTLIPGALARCADDTPLIPGASLVYSPGVTVNRGRSS
jgi:hypothetical protein